MSLWPWMLSHPELAAAFLLGFLMLLGLWLSYGQLRLTKRTEQAQLVKNMYEYWASQTMAEGRGAIREIVADKDADALREALEESIKERNFDRWLLLTRVGNFFEMLGNLAHDKGLDISLIAGGFRTNIISYYEAYIPYINACRPNEPAIYKYFEWLRKKIEKVKV